MSAEDITPEVAEEKLQDAISRARTGAVAVRNWESVLRQFRDMYEENGFGRDMKKIMMMPARES
ncbi:hypothetical protein SEA_FIZZLES_43 [Microbacterium phage Fizzles]|nr:hypothetical protein SEA_FIZZLES_43 [Microbacterium phage Fizzles]